MERKCVCRMLSTTVAIMLILVAPLVNKSRCYSDTMYGWILFLLWFLVLFVVFFLG